MIDAEFELPGVTRVSDTVIDGQLKNRTLYIDRGLRGQTTNNE